MKLKKLFQHEREQTLESGIWVNMVSRFYLRNPSADSSEMDLFSNFKIEMLLNMRNIFLKLN